MDIKSVEKRAYKISFIFHGVIVLAIVIASLVSKLSCAEEKHEEVLNIDFTVDVTGFADNQETESVDDLVPELETDPEPEPVFEPEPEPVESAKPDVIPEPKPEKTETKRKPIQRSTKVVNISTPQKIELPPASSKSHKSDLTKEEVEKLLGMGAKPSDKTVVPGERERCLAIVKNKLYDAWRRPSLASSEVARPVELTIWLGKDGYITKYQITKHSGNKSLDDSVTSAASAVRRIPGLTSGFIEEHQKVTIEFILK